MRTPPRTPTRRSNRVVSQYIRGTAAGLASYAARRVSDYIQQRANSTYPRSDMRIGGVSNQVDTATVFSKRRKRRGKAAYRRKRYAKSFKRQYRKNILADLGTNSILFNDNQAGSIVGTNTQSIGVIHLFGKKGNSIYANEHGELDLAKILSNASSTNETTEKCYIKSAHLDFTFHNVPTVNNVPMEVDLYWIGYKKKAQITSLIQAFSDAASDTGLPSGNVGFSDYTLSQRGATPFQFPAALSKGINIFKKVKHFVPPGGFFSTQWKMTRPKIVSIGDMNREATGDDLNYNGYTVSCLIIMKNVTGVASDAISNFSMGTTRTYSVKVLQDNKDYNQCLVNGG